MPREWIAPPDYDSADGELLEEEEDDETAAMLHQSSRRTRGFGTSSGNGGGADWDDGLDHHIGNSHRVLKDTDGRNLPTSEQAPSTNL